MNRNELIKKREEKLEEIAELKAEVKEIEKEIEKLGSRYESIIILNLFSCSVSGWLPSFFPKPPCFWIKSTI